MVREDVYAVSHRHNYLPSQNSTIKNNRFSLDLIFLVLHGTYKYVLWNTTFDLTNDAHA